MCTHSPNFHYLDALNVVLDWQLPDHLLPIAVAQEARLMAGFDAEQPYQDVEDIWLSPESYVAFQ